MYGLYGLKHHTVEISGDVTMQDGETNEEGKIELLSPWMLEGRVSQKYSLLNMTNLKFVFSHQVKTTFSYRGDESRVTVDYGIIKGKQQLSHLFRRINSI